MKKVLFFTQNRWAFGSIHHALCKELYKHGIYANLLSWDQSYKLEEFDYFNQVYDIFVTQPDSVLLLHNDYKVPLNKICAVAHGQWDILLAMHTATFDFYPELHSFACVSNILLNKCKEWGFYTLPKVVELGIHFDLFYKEPSRQLNKVGYAGAYETLNFFKQEIKRGRLFFDIQKKTDLNFIGHNYYNYMTMPAFYWNVDSVIMTSIEEAGGLPMMESAAAGRLPIGTPVGYFEHNAPLGGGVLAPIEEGLFVDFVANTLNFYKDNPVEYRQKCLQVQQFARDNYDWGHKIGGWVELLG